MATGENDPQGMTIFDDNVTPSESTTTDTINMSNRRNETKKQIISGKEDMEAGNCFSQSPIH
jgi:hypothetical protein